MADVQYISEDYARTKVNVPNRQAEKDELLNAIVDATDIIDQYLKTHAVTISLPLAEVHRTEDFMIAVAYWVGSIIYMRNGQLEQGAQMLHYAQELMDGYIATHDFGGAVASNEPTSEPIFYQYSSKGELKQTDLTDPLDLSNE